MAPLKGKRGNVLLLAALLFGQLVLMSASVRRDEGATMLEGWAVRATSPVVAAAQWVAGGVGGVLAEGRMLLDAHGRNADLVAELNQVREELRLRREATLENARLRDLLQMSDESTPESIGGSVVMASLSAGTQMVLVDRGSREGVRRDFPVVARGAAVGRVLAVYGGRAKVILLTDPNSGVAGIVQRTRAQGVVLGQGWGKLALLYVPRHADVEIGDRVVTSGVEGLFPRGFGIGRVVDVQIDSSGSQILQLEPEIDYATLEEVLILKVPGNEGLMQAPDGSPHP